MNILMLATQLFSLPLDGGALRTWHILRQAAKRHEVTLLGMHLPGQAPSGDERRRIEAVARRVIAVERPAGLGFKAGNAVRSLYTCQPYNLGAYCFPAFRDAIAGALRGGQYDVVHAHHPHTAQYYPVIGDVAALYDAQNIYAELWRAYAETPGRSLVVREIAMRQAGLTGKVESRAFQDFDVTTMCSEADRLRALDMAAGAPIYVSPNGVDCEYFAPSGEKEEAHSLVFTGAMDVPANIDACRYCVEEILPRVWKGVPDARLYLVGKNPAPAVRRLASKNVTVTGTVPDVRPFQARAQIVLAPLRGGSGTRLKILEAMAMGKAVVSTSVGAEGIAYANGENVLIADTPEEFSAAVTSLLGDVERRRRLGAAARRMICERYSWDRLEAVLDGFYTLAVERAKARRRRA